MSKKKHPEHVNHERWLVSYADFITLLFAFFVVLFASGQSDKKKQVQLRHAMEVAFAHNGIFAQHSKTPPLSADSEATQEGKPTPLALPIPNAREEAEAQHVREAVAAQVAAHALAVNVVTLHAAPEGLTVSLHEAGFFGSGSAEIRPQALEALRAIAQSLPQQAMRVEGHTDDLPIHTAQFATNWELSTARAAAIARLLISEHVVEPTQISAAGYAEFHPIADNATEQGRAQNRRVDIVLLSAKP